ncbi:MAG: hypothetical protein Kow0021_02190 [Methanothermobacter thermautotrophicus]
MTNEEMQNIKGKFLQFIWSGIQAYMTVYGLSGMVIKLILDLRGHILGLTGGFTGIVLTDEL